MLTTRVSPMILLAALTGALLAPSAACGQEVIAAGPFGSPPAGEAPASQVSADRNDSQSPEAIGRWAQGVLAGNPSAAAGADPQPAKPTKACTPAADRKPHGEIWVGAGSGGYREIGGVVTQPIGDCASVTVAVDRMQGGGFGRRR